jgi:hypothetical protein
MTVEPLSQKHELQAQSTCQPTCLRLARISVFHEEGILRYRNFDAVNRGSNQLLRGCSMDGHPLCWTHRVQCTQDACGPQCRRGRLCSLVSGPLRFR